MNTGLHFYCATCDLDCVCHQFLCNCHLNCFLFLLQDMMEQAEGKQCRLQGEVAAAQRQVSEKEVVLMAAQEQQKGMQAETERVSAQLAEKDAKVRRGEPRAVRSNKPNEG